MRTISDLGTKGYNILPPFETTERNIKTIFRYKKKKNKHLPHAKSLARRKNFGMRAPVARTNSMYI